MPLPEQTQANDPASPQSGFSGAGAVPFVGGGGLGAGGLQGRPAEDCMSEFIPLREEAERRGRLIKAASERNAPPDEGCRLIGDFERAEARMIDYIERHRQSCAIPEQVFYQLKNGHKGTEGLLNKVCAAAGQADKDIRTSPYRPDGHERAWPPKGPTGDFERR